MSTRSDNAAIQVFKPSLRAAMNGPLVMIALLVALCAVALFIRVDAVAALVALLVGVLLLAALVVAVLRGRLEVRPGSVRHRRTFGSATIPAAALDRIVWIPNLQSSLVRGIVMSRVAGIDRRGKAVLRLTSRVWSREAVMAAASALAGGTQVHEIRQQIGVDQLRSIEPMAVSWPDRRPILAVVLGFGTVLVVIPLIAIAVFLLTAD